MSPLQRQLTELIQPLVAAGECEFWGLELVQSRGSSLLRVYIERDDRHINVDDCARISHAISDALDVLDPITEDYRLEVSSPGVDRPLYALDHYQRAIGEELRLETHLPKAGRKRYRARVQSVDGQNIILQFDKSTVVLAFSEIAKARVIPDFSQPLDQKFKSPVDGADPHLGARHE